MTRSSNRAGFTLLEMLVVMWALAALLGLGMALLLTVMRADQIGAATLRDLSRQTELADQFRTDVARTVETAGKFDKYTAGPACLILRTVDGPVIYHWHDKTLERINQIDGKESRRPIAVGENSTVEFLRPAGERPIISVRVITSPPRGTVKQMEIAAALGGDTQ